VTFQAFSSLSVERNVFIDVFVPRKFLFMETFFGREKEIMRIRGEEQKMIRLLQVNKKLMKTLSSARWALLEKL